MVTIGTGIGTALINDGVLIPNSELGHIFVDNHLVDTWVSDATRAADEIPWKRWTRRLDEYLTQLHEIIWPELIVVGGGIVKHADKFLDRVDPGLRGPHRRARKPRGHRRRRARGERTRSRSPRLTGVEMQLGMIGLGRMGANLVRRSMAAGHECVVYDHDPAAIEALVADGAVGASSAADMAAKLTPPRAVWLMVPAGVTGVVVDDTATHLSSGDTIIDGGNSHYVDDIARSQSLAKLGIDYVDCGTSGGRLRARARLLPHDRRPRGSGATARPDLPRRSRRARARSSAPTVASGEPTHRGDGLPALRSGGRGPLREDGAQRDRVRAHGRVRGRADDPAPRQHRRAVDRPADAETAPLAHPELYQYDLDIPKVAEVWRRGSVVASWLLDLTANALHESPDLAEFSGRVSDSGEGRWTLMAAIDEGVPAPVIATALMDRFISQGAADYTNKMLSAMRKQFGGHEEKKA